MFVQHSQLAYVNTQNTPGFQTFDFVKAEN